MYDHKLFGLRIRSDLNLPELQIAVPQGDPDVRIRLAALSLNETAPGFTLLDGKIVLTVPSVGRFVISGGREILIAPKADATERNVRVFLLGSAMGALLHQRGLMPLHANAIDLGGRAIAFCGHSGAGKSTMASWFNDQGYPILADDVCVIDFDKDNHAVAQPGLPRLRLWDDALVASGRVATDYERSFDNQDEREKFDVPTSGVKPLHQVPLAAIYLLAKAPDGNEESRIERLNGVAAVDALVANTYRGHLLQMMGSTGTHLMTCLRITRGVPIMRAERLWGHERFDEQARLLEAHALQLMRAEQP